MQAGAFRAPARWAGPPAPPPTTAASEEARRSLHKGFMKTTVSDSLATLRVDKLVGGTTVGNIKDAVRDWLGLVDTELRRQLCSRQHSAQETAARPTSGGPATEVR